MKSTAWAITGAIAGALLAAAIPALADSKVALVIGNSKYIDSPLKNPENDAKAMARLLREKGFDVIERVNATKPQMESAVADFSDKLSEGATGLFFYAGHGMQVNGHNYLIPVDARLVSEQRVKLETLDVDVVVEQMKAARAKVSMVILDACRNNPFERRFRSVGGGLAQLNAPEGSFIAYATAPGSVAADGDANNGVYTQAILTAMARPGLKVEDVFKQVRIDVSKITNGVQVPWEASSLTGNFFFTPPAADAAEPSIAAERDLDAQQQALERKAAELLALQQQLASLPAGGANAQFDGRYVSDFRMGSYRIQATLEITGLKIVGRAFGAKPSGGSNTTGSCGVSGTLTESGDVQRFEIRCMNADVTFSGRFQPDPKTGAIVGETQGRNPVQGDTNVLWVRTGDVD